MSAYRVAIDQTTRTIEIRAKYFRNLIVVVAALSLGSIGWAAVTWTLPPLRGLLLLVPICGFFFFLDGKLLADWRSRLVAAWAVKDIDFCPFRNAVSAVATLPKDTLRSMLATLPTARDLIAEHRISSSTREAVAAIVAGIHACQSDIVALKAAGAAILSGSVLIATADRRWEPLLGSLVLFLLPLAGGLLKRRRIESMKQKTAQARAKSHFSIEDYMQLVAILQWNPISRSEKEGLFR